MSFLTRLIDPGQIVIGLGSGRCGTQSLAHLLDSQLKSAVTHEKAMYGIGWNNSDERVLAHLRRFRILSRYYALVGDIGFYYLPYVEQIWRHDEKVLFVCLQRDKEETIQSFVRWAGKDNFNFWINHNGQEEWERSRWDRCFPSYEAHAIEDALSQYYDDYYMQARVHQEDNPERFAIFPTDILNSREGQEELFDYLNVDAPQYKGAVHTHQSPVAAGS